MASIVEAGMELAIACSVSNGMDDATDCTVPTASCASRTGCITKLQASTKTTKPESNKNLDKRDIDISFRSTIIMHSGRG
jgi:hypothetical protein